MEPPRPVDLPYGSVGPADWGDRPCIIVATGPSLGVVGLDGVRDAAAALGARLLAVKEAGFDFPEAEACICVDGRWTRRRQAELNGLRPQLYVVAEPPWTAPVPAGAIFLRPQGRGWLSRDPARLVMGCTSGFAALNFAVLRGARRIVLVGFDYRHGPDGQHHGLPHHNPWYPAGNERLWSYWRDPFSAAAQDLKDLGAEVVNASPGSALTAFPKVALHEAFPHLRRL